MEPGTSAKDVAVIHDELKGLAAWLRLDRFKVEKVVKTPG
jgi:hypothetical protein